MLLRVSVHRHHPTNADQKDTFGFTIRPRWFDSGDWLTQGISSLILLCRWWSKTGDYKKSYYPFSCCWFLEPLNLLNPKVKDSSSADDVKKSQVPLKIVRSKGLRRGIKYSLQYFAAIFFGKCWWKGWRLEKQKEILGRRVAKGFI